MSIGIEVRLVRALPTDRCVLDAGQVVGISPAEYAADMILRGWAEHPGAEQPKIRSAADSPSAIDYRALLVKYMTEVVACEGVSFVDCYHYSDIAIGYTPEELVELRAIAAEVEATA